jgi:hypothetical protein
VATLGQIGADSQKNMLEAVAEVHMLEGSSEVLYEPLTYDEAQASPQHCEWSAARLIEKRSLHKRKVMAMALILEGVKIIKSKYAYKIKRNMSGGIKQFKARLVILGCQLEKNPGIDQKFAPVVKGLTIRLITGMALAFVMNVLIHQIDISSAFCYADIEEDVYMKPPPEMKLPEGYCLKLFKSLYGLRASPRNWNHHLDKYVKSLHFTP